ncbi:MAG: YggT family protein [Actinomycetota bacterium]|nr:YggT family protein [Actinomycetota bacterium]
MRLAFDLVIYFLQIYVWIIILRAILSWFNIRPRGLWFTVYRFIAEITDPFLKIFKRIIPSIRVGRTYLDLSFIVAVLAIQFIIFLLRIIMYKVII